jgi:hypothetical protein
MDTTKSMVIMLKGHLFDSGLINQVLDVLEANHCLFEFQECQVVRPWPYYYPEQQENNKDTLRLQQQRLLLKSRAILKITTAAAKANGDDDDTTTTTTMQQQVVDNADTIFGIVELNIEALVAAIETRCVMHLSTCGVV